MTTPKFFYGMFKGTEFFFFKCTYLNDLFSNGIQFSSHLYHAQKDLAKAGTKRLGILLSILEKKDD